MKITTYESLSSFFGQENFSEGIGDYVHTLGFDAAGDGGASMFKVVSVPSESINSTLEIDGRTFVCNGINLELIPENNTVHVEQFGAKGDFSISKDLTEEEQTLQKTALAAMNKNAICQAMKAAVIVEFMTKQYLVGDNITINCPRTFLGNNATLVMYSEEDYASMFIINCSTDTALEDIKFNDFFLFASEEAESYTGRTVVSVTETHKLTFDNVAFACAEYVVNVASESTEVFSENISFINCLAEEVYNGLFFENTKDIKIRNFRINHPDTEFHPDAVSGIGLKFSGNCFGANVEDLSVFNSSGSAVAIENGEWNNDATNSIFFKNLLVDGVKGIAIRILTNNIPIRFANAMVVNARIGISMQNAENIDVVNSSFTVTDPTGWMINLVSYVKTKFTKTQFEFPANFQKYYQSGVLNKTAELTFVDCTLQKTDVGDDATGFGTLGYTGGLNCAVIQTFDACEFRSYQKDFATFNSDGTITNYKPSITLATKTVTNNDTNVEKSSKVVIKNCRFVNDSPCSAPYFMLDDAKTYDNIVIYNCFFENYTYSETADGAETFPLFAKVTDGVAVADSTGHNIFAKCNMRSSTPIRGEGTTINETKEYQ